MNAASIWVGHAYAWCPSGKPRGVETPRHGVRKIIARKVYKRTDYLNTRATTFVEAVDPKDETRVYQARARDIVDFWDDYSARLEAIEREAAKAREERDLAVSLARALDAEMKQALLDAGLTEGEFHDYRSGKAVVITYEGLRRLLRNYQEA